LQRVAVVSIADDGSFTLLRASHAARDTFGAFCGRHDVQAMARSSFNESQKEIITSQHDIASLVQDAIGKLFRARARAQRRTSSPEQPYRPPQSAAYMARKGCSNKMPRHILKGGIFDDWPADVRYDKQTRNLTLKELPIVARYIESKGLMLSSALMRSIISLEKEARDKAAKK